MNQLIADPDFVWTAERILWIAFPALFLIYVILSTRRIGPSEVGLVTRRFSLLRLSRDSPIAFDGEAGYQADLLMPGLRFKGWPLYSVRRYPWVQIPAGEIGVVISQIGQALPIGAKSAAYKEEFGHFTDLRSFVKNGGQSGVQRPVLPPGTLLPIHPIGFLVITKDKVYGEPISAELRARAGQEGALLPASFGLDSAQLDVMRIEPQVRKDGTAVDIIGIVTTYEGEPNLSGEVACRLGGFSDVLEMERKRSTDAEMTAALLESKNDLHKNYQDFQAFLDHGGRIGLQHDPLPCGAYALNPFLLKVERVPALFVKHGEVAVIKAYVGLAEEDASEAEPKFGRIVRPGHRGVWRMALPAGKYAVNPRCYEAEKVPISVLNLNWSDVASESHGLDAALPRVVARSHEGFTFKIDLQVQIQVQEARAPMMISKTGTMRNLLHEVLHPAIDNHFRVRLQGMPAVQLIETRQRVQEEALEHIRRLLEPYQVETLSLHIQEIDLPEVLVEALTQREVANQEIETLRKQRSVQEERIAVEHARGMAAMQAELAKSKVEVEITANVALARAKEGRGEAEYLRLTAAARGSRPRRPEWRNPGATGSA